MVNGDAESRSHWVSYALGTTATAIVGTKGAGALTKTGVATTKTAVQKSVTTVQGTMNTMQSSRFAQLLPYGPHTQVALPGGMPFKVINGPVLKENLFMQAEKLPDSGGGFKGPLGRQYKNYKPVEYKGSTLVNGETRDISRRVYQRKDIDYNLVDSNTGLSNLELMKLGRPPIWKDGSKIELHHLIQKEPGSIVELPKTLHQEYSQILHGLVENGGSFRRNSTLKKQYNNFRTKYWKWRANEL